MKTQIEYLYENTDLTIADIADKLDISFKVVWSWINKKYDKETRKARKILNYQRSKRGFKNPMFGKYGERHPNYKGEVGDGRGYLMVLKPDWYTGRKGSKHVFKHTVVMCAALGLTELPPGFVIHHIDGDPKNNDIDNLVLFRNSAHTKFHARERATTISKESRVQEDPKRGAAICKSCKQELRLDGFCLECVPYG